MAGVETLTGDTGIHDPSRIMKCDGRYYIYGTGRGILSKSSTDLNHWTAGPPVFGKSPAWATNAVRGFRGTYWAPDLVWTNGLYYLYYSVSTFGSQVSVIGLATSPTLNPGATNYLWTDRGPVIQSTTHSLYNTIDPCPVWDAAGNLWLSFGSFWHGIYLTRLDSSTGKLADTNGPVIQLAHDSAIEASHIIRHGDFYYLFVNWGACCRGVNSTYDVRVGRSAEITGPYVDRGGNSLVDAHGEPFLESSGRYVGPGQIGVFNDDSASWFTFHYYDGLNDGTPTLGLSRLMWTADGWPVFAEDWSAFYAFQTDASDEQNHFNGTLSGGAIVTNFPGRGSVLSLDGKGQFVTLPWQITDASTFAGWIRWNGGKPLQRIFDFGNATNAWLYLTPDAGNGRMRFAITTNGASAEQHIDAPSVLPTGEWTHVAVTLDGTNGVLYVNGAAVTTNNNLTIRPWQTLAQYNYLGKSEFPGDPYFDGLMDSFSIYGRVLNAADIARLHDNNPKYSLPAPDSEAAPNRSPNSTK